MEISRHFKRLSLTVAAKQNRDVGNSFGSTGKHLALQEPETEASKAFLAASEARAKDLEQTRAKAVELLKKVREKHLQNPYHIHINIY